MKFFKKFQRKTEVQKVAEEQLKKNMSVLESLRDYDEGKKQISTSDIERNFPNIRIATKK